MVGRGSIFSKFRFFEFSSIVYFCSPMFLPDIKPVVKLIGVINSTSPCPETETGILNFSIFMKQLFENSVVLATILLAVLGSIFMCYIGCMFIVDSL